MRSSLTTLGTHGAHVTLGLFWGLFIILQVKKRGLTPETANKSFIFSLYWHFLDVVWIFIFSFYLPERNDVNMKELFPAKQVMGLCIFINSYCSGSFGLLRKYVTCSRIDDFYFNSIHTSSCSTSCVYACW